MATVLLALGTNLGNRADNLRTALRRLATKIQLTATSPVYETEPRYVTDQPLFLNMTAAGETELSPMDLLGFVKSLERQMGRTTAIRYGPRLIDVDILFYDDEVLALPGLTIPHPRLCERAFVLRPLADIAADWVHPQSGETVAGLLAALPEDDGVVLKLAALNWDLP